MVTNRRAPTVADGPGGGLDEVDGAGGQVVGAPVPDPDRGDPLLRASSVDPSGGRSPRRGRGRHPWPHRRPAPRPPPRHREPRCHHQTQQPGGRVPLVMRESVGDLDLLGGRGRPDGRRLPSCRPTLLRRGRRSPAATRRVARQPLGLSPAAAAWRYSSRRSISDMRSWPTASSSWAAISSGLQRPSLYMARTSSGWFQTAILPPDTV